jgi:hypothetical protein
MSRPAFALVLALVALAAGLATARLFRPAPAAGEPARSDGLAQQRWRALRPAEQLALRRLYGALASRPDAAEMFQRARRFAALPEPGQLRLRELQQVLSSVLARLPPGRRRELLLLHERARAEKLYHLLEAEQPQVLARLRGQAEPAP